MNWGGANWVTRAIPGQSHVSTSGGDILASSVLGDWTVFVQWGDMNQPYPWTSGALTFDKDRSWTSDSHSGWWIQQEKMLTEPCRIRSSSGEAPTR